MFSFRRTGRDLEKSWLSMWSTATASIPHLQSAQRVFPGPPGPADEGRKRCSLACDLALFSKGRALIVNLQEYMIYPIFSQFPPPFKRRKELFFICNFKIQQGNACQIWLHAVTHCTGLGKIRDRLQNKLLPRVHLSGQMRWNQQPGKRFPDFFTSVFWSLIVHSDAYWSHKKLSIALAFANKELSLW